jgi:hypothetical protein
MVACVQHIWTRGWYPKLSRISRIVANVYVVEIVASVSDGLVVIQNRTMRLQRILYWVIPGIMGGRIPCQRQIQVRLWHEMKSRRNLRFVALTRVTGIREGMAMG